MEEQLRNEEIEIDLRELFHALMEKWWILALCLVIGLAVAAGFTKFLVTPQYESSSMIYILTKTTSVTSLADIQMGTQLTVDFETLATSRPVVDDVRKALQLEDIPYEDFVGMITVENPADTRILKLTAEYPDAKVAKDIANAMADATAQRVAEVMDTDKPSIVEEGVVAENPSSPSFLKNTLIGGLLGLFLAGAVIVILFMMDDTIKSEDEVSRYLQLNTLAAIPRSKGEKPGKKKRPKKRVA